MRAHLYVIVQQLIQFEGDYEPYADSSATSHNAIYEVWLIVAYLKLTTPCLANVSIPKLIYELTTHSAKLICIVTIVHQHSCVCL